MRSPGGPDMDNQHDDSATRTRLRAAPASTPSRLPDDPEERADLLEDRRLQWDQDWAELGGEA
ncbi:hypothetical protein [Geodermatophilus normandii]|nr:hypothetical protein [Geodermatophilus normandii]